jgi:hypothetical protein
MIASPSPSQPVLPTGKRDLFVDFLRGLCILSMVFTHAGQQTLVGHLALSGTVGFFSGAEGFFFLSGMVFGKVYQRRMHTLGVAATGTAIWRRVLKLYKYHLGCIACVLLTGLLQPTQLLALDVTYSAAIEHPVSAFFKAALLTYQPNYLDVLPLYIVFLPLAWLLIRSGRDSSPWLPVVSATLWALQQWSRTAFGSFISPGAFNVLSYQLVFFTGFWVAHGLPKSIAVRQGRPTALLFASALIVALCFVASHPKALGMRPDNLAQFTETTMAQCDKLSLGWLRVVNFSAMALLLHQARPWLRWVPLQPLAALGKRSLGVFVVHVAILIVLCGPALMLRSMPSLIVMVAVLGPVAMATMALYAIDRKRNVRSLPPNAPKAFTISDSAVR